MKTVRKNKYSRGEVVNRGNGISITPRPVPQVVRPQNSYEGDFHVQHVASNWGGYEKFMMISGENIRNDFAGKVKLPDGSTVQFESVDQLEIGDGVRYIVIRLDPKKETLEALAVEDWKDVPKGMLQRVLAVVDRDRVKQIHFGDTVDFGAKEESFEGFED